MTVRWTHNTCSYRYVHVHTLHICRKTGYINTRQMYTYMVMIRTHDYTERGSLVYVCVHVCDVGSILFQYVKSKHCSLC